MRWLSVAWLASFACGNLLANGANWFSMSSSLQDTAVAPRLMDIFKVIVGQQVRFSVVQLGDDNRRYFTAKVARVVLPDISKFIESGNRDDVQLKLEVSEVQAENPQEDDGFLPQIIAAKDVEPNHLNLSFADLVKIDRGIVGERVQWVRLLGAYRDVPDGEEPYWEVLVEMERSEEIHVGDKQVKIAEPYIEKLLFSENVKLMLDEGFDQIFK